MTADTVGGVWAYTEELVAGILQHGHQVTLITLGKEPEPAQTQWATEMAASSGGALQVDATGFKLEWMQESAASVAESMRYVGRAIERLRPDLCHFNQFCFGALKTNLPKVVVAHSDVASWWRAVYGEALPDSEWSLSYKELVLAGLSNATAVVAPSCWMHDQLTLWYQLDVPTRRRIRVIYNGVSNAGRSGEFKKRMQAASLGRVWDRGKQIGLLLEAKTQVPVVIAGEMRSPDAEAEERLTIPGNVTMLPHLDRTAARKLLEESAMYVVTSCYEPFGLAAVEAALAGCAVVANDIPSMREIWGDAAVYYPRNSAHALGETLDRIAGDADSLAVLAEKARQRTVDRYTAERQTGAYGRLYQTLGGGR